MSERRNLRCAIYTRVSTEQGLDQEFNSLHAQRDACASYIRSQTGEGWRLVPTPFDDGGFSGGSMERPALQSLVAQVRHRAIDVIVVYKVDRLTRSLADFAKLVELFDANGVSFVSVTQSFNTTTSMGRLTLNVLLSFAQFEREVTGERIRDKIAASKRKGIRVGGPVPLGYRLENKKLIVDPSEADLVRTIFERYLALGSLQALITELDRIGARTKRTTGRQGTIRGGVPFRKGSLAWILCNRVYVGDLVHKGRHVRGEQDAIVGKDLFDAVQSRLDEQRRNNGGLRLNTGSLLLGRLFDGHGHRMTMATTNKQGVRYRYYVSAPAQDGSVSRKRITLRIPAEEIEATVLRAVSVRLGRTANPDHRALAEAGTALAVSESASTDEAANAAKSKAHPADLVCAAIEGVTLGASELQIRVTNPGQAEPVLINVPWTRPVFRRRRELLGADLLSPPHRPIRSETRARLVEAIALARQWVDDLVSGRVTDTQAIADREQLSERSVRTRLNLAFLSPAIVRAAVDGTLRENMGLCSLTNQPIEWQAPEGR